MKADKQSGIYIYKCVPTGKVYIGQTTYWAHRKSAHTAALRNKRHYNPYLQSAYDKYGEDKFTWEFIECDPNHLTEMEQWTVDQNKGNVFNYRLRVNDPTPSSTLKRSDVGKMNKGRKMPASHKLGGLLRTGDNNVSRRPEIRRILSGSKTFTDEQCVEIYTKYQQGFKQLDLAKEYGCDRGPIRTAIKYATKYLIAETKSTSTDWRRKERGEMMSEEYKRTIADKKKKLTDEQCLDVYYKYKSGKTQEDLAMEYGVSRRPIKTAVAYTEKYLLNKV